jgi:hypothetical protein
MVNFITRRKAAGIGVLGAILATLATAPSAHAGTYYACVKKKGGAIRIVSRAAKCKRSERKISFNGEGPPGRNGRDGRNGKNGSNGKNGTNGTNGVNGTSGFTSTLPKGATEKGTWALAMTANTGDVSAISFNIPLAATPAVNVIAKGGLSSAACPGKVGAPAAVSGNLCIYASRSDNIAAFSIEDPSFEGGMPNHASPWGTTVKASAGATLPGVAYGTWAVTG